MAIENLTRNTTLAEHIISIGDPFTNIIDFLRERGLPQGYALWISPCRTIYTTGMKMPVDIIFINSQGIVVTIYKELPPFCFADTNNEAVSAIELPAQTIKNSKTQVGDRLRLSFI